LKAKQKRFIKLRAKGCGYKDIAERLGVTTRTLIRWSKQFSVEIHNLKAIEFESLCDEYMLGRFHRIKVLGTEMNQVVEELVKRDLSDVMTHRLFDMQQELRKEIKGEVKDVAFIEENKIGSISDIGKMLTKTESWQG
jgi:transposase-like protein